MEKLKSPGIPARDASSVALADESIAMNVPATKVTASKTPRIEEMERRRLRRTSRAAYRRRPKVPSTLAPEKGSRAIRALAPFGKLRPSTRNPYWVALYRKELLSPVQSVPVLKSPRALFERADDRRIERMPSCGTGSLLQRSNCRASGSRLLTAKAVRKRRWLYRPKDVLRIGGYDARCGGSLRLWAAARDWSSCHRPHGGGFHARGPQRVHDVREVPNHPGWCILESRRARRGRPFRSAAFRQRIRCEWQRPVRLSPRERERSDNGAGELYRFRDAP